MFFSSNATVREPLLRNVLPPSKKAASQNDNVSACRNVLVNRRAGYLTDTDYITMLCFFVAGFMLLLSYQLTTTSRKEIYESQAEVHRCLMDARKLKGKGGGGRGSSCGSGKAQAQQNKYADLATEEQKS